MDHEVTMCPTHKSARFESSCITSHISMALQTIGDLFFLIATYQGLTYILTTFQRFIHTHKRTHELAQLLLMFFKLHVFQEILMDLAGVGSFYAALRIKMSSMVFEFGRCVLFLDETCLPNLGIIQYLLSSL